jgi:hypothetical protein
MTILAELPTDLVALLEGIEDDVDSTDQCVETFENLYTLATEGTPILLDVLAMFMQTCIGG